MQNNKGFTLMELMVVIAVIAILSAVAIPMYANYTIRARVGSVLGTMGAIKTEVAEKITANNGSLSGISSNGDSLNGLVLPTESNSDLAYTTSVTDGVITATIVIPVIGNIILTPTIASGSINWTCSSDLPNSQRPSSCEELTTTSDNTTVEDNDESCSLLGVPIPVSQLFCGLIGGTWS